MRNATDIITAYVLEKIVDEPVARRAEVYRALAFTAAPAERVRFEKLAGECDAIDAAHAQLVFNFQRKAGGAR